MGDRIDESRRSSNRTSATSGSSSADSLGEGPDGPETSSAEPDAAAGGISRARSSHSALQKETGAASGRGEADGWASSTAWSRMERHVADVNSVDDLTDRAIHRLTGLQDMHAGELRQLVSDRSALRANLDRALTEQCPNASAAEIDAAVDNIVEQSTVAFGDRVSELIGHRVRNRLRGIEVAPETINESDESRRAFLKEVAESTGGDPHRVRVALSKLNVRGERADRIVDAIEKACEERELDALGDPDSPGPDVITGWSDGLYQNAADDLEAGLDETLAAIDSLRSQLGHRDMATPESANLVNPNVSETRDEVLDALGIGDITDNMSSETGDDAELALTEYRTKLLEDDQWTEKLGSALEESTFVVADYFSGGAASAGAGGMELFVAWHEANMADFAERHADTAQPGSGAEQWRAVGEMATEQAVEVVAGQLVDGLPTPSEAPAHVEMVIDQAKSRFASEVGAAAGNYATDRVSDVAGETTVEP